MRPAGGEPLAGDRPVVPSPAPAPFLKAAALMLLSTVFFGLMAIVIRVASNHGLPTVEIAFFRNVFGLLVLLPFLRGGGPAVFRTRQLPRYFLRSAIGVASMLCSFWAIGHLPMAQAISLSYSTPLFVTIAAAIWLGEVVRRRRWSAVLLGFVGVLVIVRPGTEGFSAGSLVAVAAAVLSSIVAIQIKQLSRVDAPDTIVLYTYVFWVPLSLVPALFAWQWPQGMDWLWLACPVAPEPIAPELWDDEAWHQIASRAVLLARDAGVLTALPVALAYRAFVHVHEGEFDAAQALIEEANDASAAAGRPPLRYTTLVLTAWEGDEAAASAAIANDMREAASRGEGRAVGLAHYASAVLHNFER